VAIALFGKRRAKALAAEPAAATAD
jgi:hypothetical protein